MTKTICPDCHYTHSPADARAIGIFQPGGPFAYMPTFDGGSIYATREEAQQATCAHRQITNCGTPGCEGWTNPIESETTE